MSLLQCEQCLNSYPIELLTVYPGEPAICRACMTGEDTRKAEELVKEKAKSIAGQLTSLEAGDIGQDFSKVKSLLADIYGNFGGTTGFASHIYWVIMELSKRKPIPASVGHLMVNLMKLHHAVEQAEEQVLAREMTDEQLRQETEHATIRMFVESAGDPAKRQMLEKILSRHGLAIQEIDPQELIADMSQESA